LHQAQSSAGKEIRINTEASLTMTVAPLEPSALYRRCDPEQLEIETTADLEVSDGLIAQERAIQAVRFGIGIHHEGYNLFALGPSGTGKYALIRSALEERARAEAVPSDWCYVFNFEDAHRPRALRLPPGKGVELKHDMDQLVEDLHRAIQGVFESDEYRTRTQALEEELEERQERVMSEIRELAKEKDVILLQTPTGFTLAPVRDGKPLGPNEFHALSDKDRARIEEDINSLQAEMRKALHQMPLWKKRSDEQIEELNREMAGAATESLVENICDKFADLTAVVEYLQQVQADVVEHFRQFLPDHDKQPLLGIWIPPSPEGPPWHHRYRINVLLGHEKNGGAPVIYADLPAHHQLVGRIEHRAHLGALETDFTMIRAGALHQANGGYLILDALKLLLQPFAWETLKRLLQAREIRIESLAQITSLISTLSLEPEPIPLDVKVVMLGERHIYYLLCELDPEFSELFKVAVDFEDQLVREARRATSSMRGSSPPRCAEPACAISIARRSHASSSTAPASPTTTSASPATCAPSATWCARAITGPHLRPRDGRLRRRPSAPSMPRSRAPTGSAVGCAKRPPAGPS
jgi:predicted ATP-dependent protease